MPCEGVANAFILRVQDRDHTWPSGWDWYQNMDKSKDGDEDDQQQMGGPSESGSAQGFFLSRLLPKAWGSGQARISVQQLCDNGLWKKCDTNKIEFNWIEEIQKYLSEGNHLELNVICMFF